ncbi:MAG: outer membrane protein assembly factor BamA, partial [Acidobacteria bacterium]|nr:outer membrane protein assembly factor BamA [Acidobacteriota bacterium]
PTPQPAKPANPFETVPQAAEPAKPVPGVAKPSVDPAKLEDVVELIEFRGARRVPQDTLRAMITTKRGDKIDQDSLNRDFMSLWNTGRFDDISLEKEAGKTGWILRFVVVERRMVRSIKYEGAKSVTVSEILDRFKERRVGLSVESQYDPNKVQRAAIVLKEYLAERGRQYATVEPELRQIPPSSMEVVFRVNEGPKVKMGSINIEGNKIFSDRVVRRAMKNLRPVGIPHSILFESLFAKTYDSSKLEEDKQRVQVFYQEKGYFTTRAGEHKLEIRDTGGKGFKIPVFKPNKPGKRADLTLNIEESRQYRLQNINAVGMKLFRTPETILSNVFQMRQGEVFSTAKLRKGLESIRKLYGEFGYIDMVPEPDINPTLGTDKIDFTLNVDEGKQFFVRRINFSGNTTTRDKVIRRELLVDEGDMFSTRLWELSILRLNQLGYFEALKEQEAAEITRDTKANTVDITLKVKERGKNSVQLSGGVSGIAGSFVSFGYSTNNFLGLGETLGISSQLGDRIRDVTFSFTEPYLLDRPIQAGFTIYMQRFNFDQAREVSLLSGRNLIPVFEQLGTGNLLNYVSNGRGFTIFASGQYRRTFARWTLSYGYDVSRINTLTSSSRQYFEFINFQGLGGPNQLDGIRTSKIIPAFTYNTIDHPITPSRGKSFYAATTFAGSFMRGNVNLIEPTVSTTWFRSGFKKGHVIGWRAMGRLVAGYGGRAAPPFNRVYMGGENDVRGFDIWGVSPMAFIPSEAQVPVLNDDGSARQQRVANSDGSLSFQPVFQNVPSYQLIFPGGDTQLIGNFEYRIPIFGPVTLAAFFDAGLNKIMLKNQLKMRQDRIDLLNTNNPSAGFDNRVLVAPGTEKLRTSTGLEMQIMMPVVNAPFRFYWAYNPTIVQNFLQPPVVLDRSAFPNQATFINSVATWGRATPFFEQRRTFRFTISRTF